MRQNNNLLFFRRYNDEDVFLFLSCEIVFADIRPFSKSRITWSRVLFRLPRGKQRNGKYEDFHYFVALVRTYKYEYIFTRVYPWSNVDSILLTEKWRSVLPSLVGAWKWARNFGVELHARVATCNKIGGKECIFSGMQPVWVVPTS